MAGNSGAFRASAIRVVGGFREDTLGEDLELTWRIQEAGYEVEFAADAIIFAEVPDNLTALWKQRVRWTRGLLQTARLHRREFRTPAKSMFHVFLPVNFFAQVIQPLIQLASMAGLLGVIVLGLTRASDWTAGLPSMWIVFGLGMSSVNIVLALILDRAWRNARHLVVLPFLLPFSLFLSCVAARAVWKEASGAEQTWNKLERTGLKTQTASSTALSRISDGERPRPSSEGMKR